MVEQTKETLENMYKVCDLVANTGNVRDELDLQGIEFKDILKIDLLCYLAYLAASDGVISWKESRFIGDLFDISMTPEKLNQIIVSKNLYSTEFENKPPIMLQVFVAFDNAVYNSPASSTFSEELGEGLIKLYYLMTRKLIEVNDRTVDTMDPGEETDAAIYLGMLQKYIEENTEKHHTDIIVDYTKKGDAVVYEGVKAPEKNSTICGSVKAPSKKH